MRWQVRKGGRVVRSEGGKGVSVVKWERWESGEVARWGGGGSWFYSRVEDAG